MNIKKLCEIRISYCSDSIFLVASVKPKLIIPKNMLKCASLKSIEHCLLHEFAHFKRKDTFVYLLANMLCCVYWFNPFVWWGVKLMKQDIETACDAIATRTMTTTEKINYAQTLISMFSRKNQLLAVIGMAISNTKKNAEKRIRGIFMKKKTNLGTKYVIFMLTIIILSTCFTTACQPTPDAPVVVGKGDGLSDLIQSTPDASSGTSSQTNDALYTKLSAPEHWSLETTALNEKINITADVDIELPGVSQLPAATASLSEFTQEDLDKIANVLGAEGAVWTEVDHTMIKEQIEQCIIDHKARRAEYEAEGDDEMVEKMEEDIEAYEQMYIDAPDEIVPKNIEFKITEMDYYDDFAGVGFEGTTQVNNQPFYFFACNAYYCNGGGSQRSWERCDSYENVASVRRTRL